MVNRKRDILGLDTLDYMPEVDAAIRRRGHRLAYLVSTTIVIFFIVALIWANFAILDEVTRGEGQVVPSSRTQVIQNLEGGILAEILVRENQIVKQGDILVRIDNIQAEAEVADKRQQYYAARAAIERAEAEIAGAPAPNFDKDLFDVAPEMVADQQRLFDARLNQLNGNIAVLESQQAQRKAEVAELRSRRRQLQNSLGVARQQYEIARKLAAENIYPRVEFLRLEREVTDLEGEIRTLNLSIPRAQVAMKEAAERIAAEKSRFRTEATDELNTLRVTLKSLEQVVLSGEDRVKRTEVRAPVRGTVKQVYLNTVGGVIRPGESIMEIVPLDDRLLIEAQIRPADIAFLRPGLKSVVKITAYDFSIYGGLNAQLEQISADTIKNEEGESFYRIYLRTEESTLHHQGKALPIIPGMTAQVEILTGQKSVLAYLLKPILKARDQALRER